MRRPWLAVFPLLALQCRPAVVGIPPAHAGVADGAPISDWLVGTEWDCVAVSMLGAQRYEVAHTWSFAESTWDSDIGDRLSEAANTGYLPQHVAQELRDWMTQDTSTLLWSPSVHTTGRHWTGTSNSTILLELVAKWSTNDGIATGFSIQPFENVQNNPRYEFILENSGHNYSIVCAEVN